MIAAKNGDLSNMQILNVVYSTIVIKVHMDYTV